MKKLNINDIAKLANVSKSTVSKVLNDYKSIPKATKNRINRIIEKNNYYSLESAHNLAKGRTDVIVFMATKYASPFISGVLEAFENRSIQAGKYTHNIITYSTRGNLNIKDDLFNRILYGKKAAALVALAINPSKKVIAQYNKFNVPVILLGNVMKGAHSVKVDNFKGAFMATEYLIKQGKKNIGFITGRTRDDGSCELDLSVVERRLGFEAAMKKYGCTINGKYVEVIHDFTYEEGRTSLSNLLKKGLKPDAIFCAAGDIVAVGVMESIREAGLKIPGDIAVIGFDDMMFAKHINPPLTTVRQPIAELGSAAFDTAVAAIEGKLKKNGNIILEPVLIVRKSA
jgi:DNA-binding LacI/PurR family transcriptional regulator